MPSIGGFFRCECSKIHARHLITRTTECTCGRLLWPQMWGTNPRKEG